MNEKSDTPPHDDASSLAVDAAETKRTSVVGPRGIKGLFGWTFFDPANIVCITCLIASGALVMTSVQTRGSLDWRMALGFYVCLAAFLRGYFFTYYHGRILSRCGVTTILLAALLSSAYLWEERSKPFEYLATNGIVQIEEDRGFHIAALLHCTSALTLFIHFVLPRRWMIKMTDAVSESRLTGTDVGEEADPPNA
ncbi:MAG: hypothetical protein VX589_21320 [Myxococcota bacterium]|nr:hypothetical protein [Myxococcota bacterium]